MFTLKVGTLWALSIFRCFSATFGVGTLCTPRPGPGLKRSFLHRLAVCRVIRVGHGAGLRRSLLVNHPCKFIVT